jgi:hypothetical protein
MVEVRIPIDVIFLLSSTTSRLALEPTRPAIQLAWETLSEDKAAEAGGIPPYHHYIVLH